MGKVVVSFLASGRGSNFTVVVEAIRNKKIKAAPGILISDREDARALDIAREFGMESYFVNPKSFESREMHEKEMVRLLKKSSTGLVVAAGYMRLLTGYFVREFKNRIINIHPAILPSFPGVHSQKQALDYGVKLTGCTAHFIDEGTDTGPIIMQTAVRVMDDDTEESLSARILKEEHRILPESVMLFCEGRLKVKGRRVIINP
jgi:phosphoribosylglycinamide formyltransferase 1